MLAGDIANTAWTRELSDAVWHKKRSQIAAFSVQIWDAALRQEPLDVTGECRERRAWSLLASGRVDEAVNQADEVMPIVGSQFRFMYNYAMAKSAQGDQAKAFDWFRRGVHVHGFGMIQRGHADKNIERMKSNHKMEYEILTQVNTKWAITFGTLNDDISLVNDSAFTLTNVTLHCTLVQGGRKWTPTLTDESIEPGEKVVWKDCVSIPGSRLDSQSATVDCDQYRLLPEVNR